MTIAGRFILPPDVVVVPVADLPEEVQSQIAFEPGDIAVTRPRSRAPSSIVNAKTADLLEHFRAPHTIVDAVIAVSAADGADPRQTLDEAFPILQTFITQGLLVPADSELMKPIAELLAAGDLVGGYEIVEPVHVVVDTEVYHARAADGSPVALKLARPPVSHMQTLFEREIAVLRHLDGRANPRLLAAGQHRDSPYVALSWCPGVDASKAAADARRLAEEDGGAAILDLATGLLGAYAHLHAQGVLHGDVHPRNVLVDGRGRVTLIDFGLASLQGSPGSDSGPRRGLDFFMEPEWAAAQLNGLPPPPPGPAGEQYSVAAVLYLLLTGEPCHAFPLEEQRMLQTLVEQPPLAFSAHDAVSMPAVERCLRRALDKAPDQRFASLAEFLDAFRAAVASDRSSSASPPAGRRAPRPTQVLLDEVIARLSVPGELFEGGLTAPTASCMNGAAGFAYALLRVAGIRSSASLLALADLWAMRAAADVAEPTGLWNAELDIVPETVGRGSMYHTESGVHAVRALVGHACGDGSSQREAVTAFLSAAHPVTAQLDVAFGRAGILIGCATLVEALRAGPAIPEETELRALGDDLEEGILEELQEESPAAANDRIRSLGVAHGWGGLLYAVLRWREASGTAPPPELRTPLEDLAVQGRPAGRGLRWPIEAGRPAAENPLPASWCNGAAGLIHLWTVAGRSFGENAFTDLATSAAWTAYEWPAETGDLCCGLAGRAYALVVLAQHTGEASWLPRARELAERAATSIRSSALRRDSLYRGEVGVALLAADLEDPDNACMPLFQSEGWGRRPETRRG